MVRPVDSSAMALDRAPHDVQCSRIERLEDLWVQIVFGRIHDIDAENGHHPPGSANGAFGFTSGLGRDRRELDPTVGCARDECLPRLRRFLRQDDALDVPELLPRIEAQLLREISTCVLVRLQGLALTPVGI